MRKILPNPLRCSLNFDINASKILIIRHAESHFNAELKKIQSMKDDLNYDQLKKLVRFSKKLIDAPLTENGVIQCNKAASLISDVRVRYIFCSPVLRALQTIQNIFTQIKMNGSPHYINEINIHVNPLIFERIEDSCDLIENLSLNQQTFDRIFLSDKPTDSISYNWDLMKYLNHKDLFQIKHLDTIVKDNKVEVLDYNQVSPYYNISLQKYLETGKVYYDHILESMEELVPHNTKIESSQSVYFRLSKFLQFINDFLAENELKENEKVLIIGHSVLFQHLYAQGVHHDTLEPLHDETNSRILDNCEIAGLNIEGYPNI